MGNTYISKTNVLYVPILGFNQLQRNKRIVIVDDFDLIKLNRDRRTKVLDYLCGFFGRVTIFMSSSMEMPTLLTSNYVTSSKQLIYYDILPLGNAKRKELISKWYHLNENSLTEDEIAVRIENARNQIDTFLGNEILVHLLLDNVLLILHILN